MTQEQFAKELGVSSPTVSGWEIGDIGVSIAAAIRIAELAEVSLDWLLMGNNDAPERCPIDTHTPEEQRLLESFQRLGKTSQAAVLRIVEVMQK